MNKLKIQFNPVFCCEAEEMYSATRRVNLIDEHVDYCGGRFSCCVVFKMPSSS